MSETSGESGVHRLVRELQGSDSTPPDQLLLISGFIGNSWRDGYILLYDQPDLQHWLLIPEALVHRIEQVEPTDQDPWGEDRVWISRQDRLLIWIQFSRDDMPRGADQNDAKAVADALLGEVLNPAAAENFNMSFMIGFTAVVPRSTCTAVDKYLGRCH